MMCPYCRFDESKVVDSRTTQDSVRRRRECLKCNRRFTTYERIDEATVKVVKKDKSRVPFERDKIRVGLEKACYKRPVSEEQIELIIANVEAKIYENYEREVPSQYIGECVFAALKGIDQVSFVRFASVYREFKDVSDFVEELSVMLQERQRTPSATE
ncbi:MAG: transcriptional regulator NrdR [Planctomycetota bacterium]|nr:transcriptional regulator NrdR [Planctomycetota bacterium]